MKMFFNLLKISFFPVSAVAPDPVVNAKKGLNVIVTSTATVNEMLAVKNRDPEKRKTSKKNQLRNA